MERSHPKQNGSNAIRTYAESAWHTHLAESNEFARFRTIQTEFQPATKWTLVLNWPDTLELCTFVVKLCSNMSVCQSCNSITDDIIFHLVCECSNVYVVSKCLQFRKNVSKKLGAHTSDQGYRNFEIQIRPLDRWRHRNMRPTIPNSHEN